MGPSVKSSVNGTKGAKHTASKTFLYASNERTPVGRATTMSGKPCRSSQKTAPLVLQFCLRSSHKRRCCAKAVS